MIKDFHRYKIFWERKAGNGGKDVAIIFDTTSVGTNVSLTFSKCIELHLPEVTGWLADVLQ